MQTHDYHLRGYQVLDFGSTVTLDLVYDYPGLPKLESTVRFDSVELYMFSHTAGTILFGIEMVPLEAILSEHRKYIESAAVTQGVRGWHDGIESYRRYLTNAGAKGWEITSSIGFDGFVIAKSVTPMPA
jgi:hypothetical protein